VSRLLSSASPLRGDRWPFKSAVAVEDIYVFARIGHFIFNPSSLRLIDNQGGSRLVLMELKLEFADQRYHAIRIFDV
jgi:hypothetical protein